MAKPLTFMNNSGDPVSALARYYDISIGDLLVVVDEVALPFGRLRARARGSAGGHNGLKSVIQHLGSEFPRLRVGVGRGDSRRDLADHVLSRFDGDESAEVERFRQDAPPGRLIVFFFQHDGSQTTRLHGLMRNAQQARRFLDTLLPTDRIAVASDESISPMPILPKIGMSAAAAAERSA